MKAVFLDRDGVINEEKGHFNDLSALRILPGVADAIKMIHAKGFKVIMVSNQGGIAKALVTQDFVRSVHAEIEKQLSNDGAVIDAIYYCPHHPQGVIAEYAKTCDCRKPEVGMITQAIARFGIEPEKSFFVGDATSDILTGKRAGLKTILVMTGHAGRDGLYDVIPDLTAPDLLGAAQYIS